MKTHNYRGDEFNKGETAMLDWGKGVGTKPCTVLCWTTEYGGWWMVKLNNGCNHYTQRLVANGWLYG
jgi:hypothetical protein